jgi:hypothetical protein
MCQHKSFLRGAKCSQIFGWLKTFGPAQNILGPVKGQGIGIKKGENWSFSQHVGTNFGHKFGQPSKILQRHERLYALNFIDQNLP